MRLSRRKPEVEAGIDMTPMIDVVFQLIIFFVTVTELSKIEIVAEIELPEADQANPEERVEQNRMVINIKKDGTILIGNYPYKLHSPELKNLLHREAIKKLEPDGFSAQTVVIRGDGRMAYEHAQGLILDCQESKIYKVVLQTRLPEELRMPE